MELYELKKSYEEYFSNFLKLESKIDSTFIQNEVEALEKLINASTFWDNPSSAAKISSKHQNLQKIIETINKIKEDFSFFEMLIGDFENGETTQNDILEFYLEFEKNFKEFEVSSLLTGDYDFENAIVEIHPGAGGTESQDWASMLYDMYTRYFNKNNFKFKVIDLQHGEPAGIKSVIMEVTGVCAYGNLKGENGIHRLVRISPFDSNAKRHTSFASVNIMPLIENDDSIIINESDLKIDVYRSSGAGGQSVNTTDSAVRITHLPTKTVITCQNERSQIQNREQAMKILRSKLVELKIQEQEAEKLKLKGVQKSIGFGSQKRSYVLHPYKMVKDHHTNCESSQADKVLNGDINEFLYYNLLNS